MVHHIVMWNFREELDDKARKEAGERIRRELEAVGKIVPGVVSLEVIINEMDSSNKDLALFSVFETAEALSSYQVHPEHVKAGGYIKTVACDRVCLDYEE